jgi:hypothetical protein
MTDVQSFFARKEKESVFERETFLVRWSESIVQEYSDALTPPATIEAVSFMHFITKASVVDPILYDSLSAHIETKRKVLRALLITAAAAASCPSESDHRKKYSNKRFTLKQSKSLDSTDEDNDDGTPRPIDVVLQTAAELILANFTHVGLHDLGGGLLREQSRQSHAIEIALLDRLLRRLVTSQCFQCFHEIGLGIAIQLRHVMLNGTKDDEMLLRCLNNASKLYGGSKDGVGLCRDIAQMYVTQQQPFFAVVRATRQLVSSESTDAGELDSWQLAWHSILHTFDTFVRLRTDVSKEPQEFRSLYGVESRRRAVLLEDERSEWGTVKNSIATLFPGHGTLSSRGQLLARLSGDEQKHREEITGVEELKFAAILRRYSGGLILIGNHADVRPPVLPPVLNALNAQPVFHRRPSSSRATSRTDNSGAT